MGELSQSTKKLIQKYQEWHLQSQAKEGVAVIHADEVASAVAAVYEKIREVVDWREEHLMRRAAIERIIKRRMLLFNAGPVLAEPLLLELIRGGHFPNDQIPEAKIDDTQRIIDKYAYILENAPPPTQEKIKAQLYDWILGVAACEIEETLCRPAKEQALIEYMTELMAEKIELRKIDLGQEEKLTQIYIAVQKALFKLDHPLITYNLIKKRYSRWESLLITDEKLKEIADNAYKLWEEIEKGFKHGLADKFYKICEKYDTPYLIMGDIVAEDPLAIGEKIKSPEELEVKINNFYKKRLNNLNIKVKRAAFYATLSIFLSKILLALAIEVPFDRYVLRHFDLLNLGLNILIPPVLMSVLVLTIRPPSKENLQQVVLEVIKIAYQRERKETYLVEAKRKRGAAMHATVSVFYLLTFFLSFGLIVWGLRKLNFSFVSIAIFLVFISLISFAGVKIRERSRELEIVRRKDSFLTIFADLFALPVVRVGKWLSNQWSKYNILVVFFNFLIELPLQSFIEFLEQWRAFLKEKREEIH